MLIAPPALAKLPYLVRLQLSLDVFEETHQEFPALHLGCDLFSFLLQLYSKLIIPGHRLEYLTLCERQLFQAYLSYLCPLQLE